MKLWSWWKKELWRLFVTILIIIAVPTVILLIWSGKFRYQYIIDTSNLVDLIKWNFYKLDYSKYENLPVNQDITITGQSFLYQINQFKDLEIDVVSWDLESLLYNTFEHWWDSFLDTNESTSSIYQTTRQWYWCSNKGCHVYDMLEEKEMPKCWLFRRNPRSYYSLEEEIQQWENPNNCKLILFPFDFSAWNKEWIFTFHGKFDKEVVLHISQIDRNDAWVPEKHYVDPVELWNKYKDHRMKVLIWTWEFWNTWYLYEYTWPNLWIKITTPADYEPYFSNLAKESFLFLSWNKIITNLRPIEMSDKVEVYRKQANESLKSVIERKHTQWTWCWVFEINTGFKLVTWANEAYYVFRVHEDNPDVINCITDPEFWTHDFPIAYYQSPSDPTRYYKIVPNECWGDCRFIWKVELF